MAPVLADDLSFVCLLGLGGLCSGTEGDRIQFRTVMAWPDAPRGVLSAVYCELGRGVLGKDTWSGY